MSVVVTSSARETFTPRELADAYKDLGHNTWTTRPASRPQRTGLASAYSSFTRRLRRAWWSLFTQPRTKKVFQKSGFMHHG